MTVEPVSPATKYLMTEPTVAAAVTSSKPRAAASFTTNAADGTSLTVPVVTEVASGLVELSAVAASTVLSAVVTSAAAGKGPLLLTPNTLSCYQSQQVRREHQLQ